MRKIWTDEDLIRATAVCHSYSEVVGALGLKSTSNRTVDRIRNRIRELELDTSHFLWGGKRRGGRHRTDEQLFCEDIPYDTTLRRRYLKIAEYKCVLCGLSEWQGRTITLQIDHVDGNNRNNRLENLRFLCPNCHSQTDTWGVTKSKK